MPQSHVAALRDAAESGVSFDGLSVTVDDETYTFATPDERHTGLSAADLADIAAANDAYVTNWHYWTRIDRTDSEQEFLRWLEHADELAVPERYDSLSEDGLTRLWGELSITTTLDAGKNEDGDGDQRRYSIRHEDDIGADHAELAVYHDPLDAREVAKHDDDGRYRPLKTAPTLQTGWAFTDLNGRALLRTIDFLYPATVHNWYLERHENLDVSHWRETAQRQTGIYDLIEELDGEQLEWLTEACCVDSQCLKRRQWDESADEPLDTPRGDGVFPCREPCSLVIAVARKLTLLEREQTHEYTFELTPSEKEQLETLIDTVADGHTEEIREADADNGANRYRARYLRAKRFDEHGQLSGAPTPDADTEN
ncbi:DR2241 family protein [Halocatena pleomorpha]|uniref:DR2241 stabilising domain-containing protein n=1 Tax=Halocatena pleomorpha TaxID=1785090 RepID=A0A3P3RA98_9EURY|nr:DR2241 family protein [Halocatena pleomorpha]RRJ30386.1 hypothetical protein EIK79_09970 [Halocatena pleomorpha]